MSRVQFGWLDRVTVPDVYPRLDDPLMPPAGPGAPAVTGIPGLISQGQISGMPVTNPGMRPTVTQKGQNFGVTIGVASTPIVQNRLEVDGFLIDVPSTAANSVWLGFGSGIQVGTGIEILPGNPYFQSPTNTREQWEIQRLLESIASMLATQTNSTPPTPFQASRVALNASDWFLVAPASTPISIMLFFIPEQQ